MDDSAALSETRSPADQRDDRPFANEGSGLVLFAKHPQVPMDNNAAERSLRNPVTGRKRYYGTGRSDRLSAVEHARRATGRPEPAGKQSVPIKDMWLYPLTRDFRSTLTQ